jgi:hypothetical protein
MKSIHAPIKSIPLMKRQSIQIILALLALSPLACAEAKPAPTEQPRLWTPTATGKGNMGTLLSMTPDHSSITLRLPDGREVTLKTSSLIQADRDYVANSKTSPAESKGIVRGGMGGTSDFIEPKTGLAAAHVLDLRAKEKRIIIDLEYPPPPSMTTEALLFLPEPMIKLCLFHIELDLSK